VDPLCSKTGKDKMDVGCLEEKLRTAAIELVLEKETPRKGEKKRSPGLGKLGKKSREENTASAEGDAAAGTGGKS